MTQAVFMKNAMFCHMIICGFPKRGWQLAPIAALNNQEIEAQNQRADTLIHFLKEMCLRAVCQAAVGALSINRSLLASITL